MDKSTIKAAEESCGRSTRKKYPQYEIAPGQEPIHIDLTAIPDFRREELAKGALELMEQVFSMPGAEERYQAWLKDRRAKQRITARAAKK